MSIVSTTTAASRRSLTTPERYREIMPATTALDATLESLIGRCTAAIERHLGRVVARERVTERLRTDAGTVILALERRPVVTIHGITLNGQAVPSSGYVLDDPAAGLLRLQGVSQNAIWDEVIGQYGQGDYGYRPGPPPSVVYEVDYTAGWIVPDQTGGDANLPEDLEAACQTAVRATLERQERGVGVTQERLGDASFTYAPSTASAGLLTDDVLAMLAPYVNVPL